MHTIYFGGKVKKTFRVLICSLTIFGLLAATATAQEVAREDTVIFDLNNNIADPENFNWFTPGTKRQHGAHQTMWEPLFILNYESGDIEPWLGVSFDANDTMDVWTLGLRDGVMWSDGEAFNADDVMFTIDMLLNDEGRTLNEAANMQQWVDSIEKIDDLTVQFNLVKPNPLFQLNYFSVRIFGSVLIMPEHVWSGQDPATFSFYDEDKGWPIGTGPYTLTSADTSRTVWDLDENWWGAQAGFMDLPEPQRIVFVAAGSEENRAQLLSNNQLDIGHSVTLGAFEAIQARNPNIISWLDELPYAWADPCARQLDINTQIAPWNDPSMRRALGHMIDRQQIVNVAYEGTTAVSRSMFVQYGGMNKYIDAIEAAGYGLSATADLEAAEAILMENGYEKANNGLWEKDGETIKVNLIINSASTEMTRMGDVVVEQLRAAGVDAIGRPVDNSTFWGSVLPTGDYDVALTWLSCSSVNEPWASMNRYTTTFLAPLGERAPGINNTQRWDTTNAEFYTLIVDAMASMPLNDPNMVDYVVEAYQYLDADTPVIPLVQASKLLPMNTSYWTGWPTQENNYNHPAFWWNHTHQIIHNLTKSGN